MPTITTLPCPFCKRPGDRVEVADDELKAYNQGQLVQVAFPNLSIDVRERIMTGICAPCFDALWADDDDDYQSEL